MTHTHTRARPAWCGRGVGQGRHLLSMHVWIFYWYATVRNAAGLDSVWFGLFARLLASGSFLLPVRLAKMCAWLLMRFQERFTGLDTKQAGPQAPRHMCSNKMEKGIGFLFFFLLYIEWPRAKLYGNPLEFARLFISGLHIFTLVSCSREVPSCRKVCYALHFFPHYQIVKNWQICYVN